MILSVAMALTFESMAFLMSSVSLKYLHLFRRHNDGRMNTCIHTWTDKLKTCLHLIGWAEASKAFSVNANRSLLYSSEIGNFLQIICHIVPFSDLWCNLKQCENITSFVTISKVENF